MQVHNLQASRRVPQYRGLQLLCLKTTSHELSSGSAIFLICGEATQVVHICEARYNTTIMQMRRLRGTYSSASEAIPIQVIRVRNPQGYDDP